MRLVHTEELIANGEFSESAEWLTVKSEVEEAILRVVNPVGSDKFTINPEQGKGRGKGNGVVPIKQAFTATLENEFGWLLEQHVSVIDGITRPGKIDALRRLSDDSLFAVEWETGNISSSHRALNKIALGMIQGHLAGGILVLPTRELYQYLTDRIGNYREIQPYFPLWKRLCDETGVLAVMAVEHDETSTEVPRIPKGTDGRALQ